MITACDSIMLSLCAPTSFRETMLNCHNKRRALMNEQKGAGQISRRDFTRPSRLFASQWHSLRRVIRTTNRRYLSVTSRARMSQNQLQFSVSTPDTSLPTNQFSTKTNLFLKYFLKFNFPILTFFDFNFFMFSCLVQSSKL